MATFLDVWNTSSGFSLATRVRRAATFWSRLLGLMFVSSFGDGEGLWLVPANGIHTCWMRFPIDVAFLDVEGRVLATFEGLAPWRLAGPVARVRSCLELRSGVLRSSGTDVGDRLVFHAQREGRVLPGLDQGSAAVSEKG
jgi:hypothetical protein